MPSWPSALAALALAALALAAAAATACGTDTTASCSRSFLRYDNFGAPFIANWCRDCHSAALPADMRQDAPLGIDFDSSRDIRRWSLQIERTSGTGATMPPAGGPALAERQMLVEWLDCGAP
jgi:uncharacterized membrane protein